MRKITLGLLLCALAIQSFAVRPPLKGFAYGSKEAPTGKEWESPEDLSLNKEHPRAWFFSFQDVENARKVLPENSDYWQSLDGNWKFNWAPDPDSRPKDFFKPEFNVSAWDDIPVPSNWNIYGIQKDARLKYGVPIYCNQPVIFQHDRSVVGDWKGGVMRTPPTDWVTYKHRNEIGSHRRDFTVPKDWDGREVFISFDGVDSFFYLWINGKYVGFSKNSRNAARFNITEYLQEGNNTLAVEVYRNSDASNLEAQDMFRLPGIYRTVALYSTPKVQINDLVAIPELDANYKNGSLEISTEVRNFGKKDAKKYTVAYSLFENKLYSDENSKVENIIAAAEVSTVESGRMVVTKTTLKIDNPNKWSAESPYRYVLVAELKDKKGKTIETVSTYVGFRKVEIRDTPASEDEFGLEGRYYYVNGQTVKLKGVNRHETNPGTGHVLSRESMEEEVMLMKRANINHVRNSHYPPDPYWFYLSDKYGLYLEDEANIESHQYYYGKESLSHPKEWENAHVARVMEMAHSTVNAPSIVIWSLGNEAGPGQNFVTAYNSLKAFDKSRPVQYERNNSIVDMGSNQYPSIGWMREAVKGKYNIKYPYHVSEYAHSMGNACGNLVDYWDAMESTNFFCGAAIWDWIDQSMYSYDPKTGERYLAYGGDFGDKPNNGQFVMNGIIFADMEEKPQYYEVKKVYQHTDVDAVDLSKGVFKVFNKYYFKDLSDYDVKWILSENGTPVKSGDINLGNLPARTRKDITIPYNFASLKSDAEYFVKFQFSLKNDQPWAKKSFVQAEEQFQVKAATGRPLISEVTAKAGKLKYIDTTSSDIKTVNGSNFEATFDVAIGTIHTLKYNGQTVIAEGNGPKLDAVRAFTNNDIWFYETWFENGLHNLKHKAINYTVIKKEGSIVLAFTVESQAPNGAKMLGGTWEGRNSLEEQTDVPFGPNDFKFTTNQIWTVYSDGSIELEASITSNKGSLVLPRLGYMMKVPAKYSNFTYYGRGPTCNYPDRKTGQFIEQYTNTVANEFVNFPKPQDMANHEDVRWCALTNGAGSGAMFIATERLSVAALQYSALDMIFAPHAYELPKAGDTYLRIDAATTGLGGNSCGQDPPLVHDQVFANSNNIGFIIRPAGKDLAAIANVAPDGEMPLSITRNKAGVAEITSRKKDAEICYTIDNKNVKIYSEAIPFRNGGTVTTWLKNSPKIKSTMTFAKIEMTQVTVIETSSQEPGEGNASHLTDGNPNTMWHTMYSVTMAQYPHWVTLDAGEVKTIKGFTYLPRTDGSNGNIKEYTINVSMDGKEWGEVVAKGIFANNSKEKKVMLKKPAKARYIRFTALSEQNGHDYASGAEITILVE